MSRRVAAYLGLTLMTVTLAVIDFCSDMWLTNADWRHSWDMTFSVALGIWFFITAWFIVEDDD